MTGPQHSLLAVVPGIALCVVLAIAGEALVTVLALPLAGPIIGLLVYALWLASQRAVDWSRPGALMLARWLGAMLVPVLVGLTVHVAMLAAAWAPLLLLMVSTTLATALVTGLLYAWLVRR
ncbi:CidA/LrgA family protein [Polymorphobacter sp.]|uniref:CidA/LrgA family protein n=1 Tax=Polymorphobacter sp. TaxID=1909290 RepID=UPI003F706BCA